MKKLTLKHLNPNSKEIKQYKQSLTCLNQYQLQASIGLMLGDASLQTQNKGRTYRMKFEWGDKHKQYLEHVSSVFDEWILSDPHKKVRLSPLGNEVITWGLQTISHKAFNGLAELFIVDKIKRINPKLIENHLTPIGLAYWFMDDGGKVDYTKGTKNKSLVLNTQGFLDQEVQSMAKELSNKYNLKCSLKSNKNRKIIVINSESYEIFKEIVIPYLIPTMQYKLH